MNLSIPCRCCGSFLIKYYCDVSGNNSDHKWFRCICCNSLTTNTDYSGTKKLYNAFYIEHNIKSLNNDRSVLKGQIEENVNLLVSCGGKSLLDIGCLEGVMMERMQENGYDCWGFDVIPEIKKYIPKAFSISEDRIVIGEQFEASLFNKQFDIVVCREVIEHVDDPFEMLNQIKMSLTPNGVAQIQTPQYSNDLTLWNQTAHLLCFEPSMLEKAIRYIGMEPIKDKCLFWNGGQCWTVKLA